MALPALLSGADCGPSNPLQALSKQFERDRGVQQDHFGPARAGPSREVFRTQSAPAPGVDQDVARFFSGKNSSSAAFAPQHAANAFDLSALHSSLPQPQQPPLQSPSSSPWATDFLSQGFQSPNSRSNVEPNKLLFNISEPNHIDVQHDAQLSPFGQSHSLGMFRPFTEHPPMFHQSPPELVSQNSEAATAAIHAYFPPEELVPEKPQQAPVNHPGIADELARTAGLLIETVKNETNPKFQNSAFLGLMRQLRDGETVVEGTNMVKGPAAAPAGDNLVNPDRLTHSDISPSKSRDEHVRMQIEPTVSFVPSAFDAVTLEQYGARHPDSGAFTQDTKESVEHQPRSAASRKSVHFEGPPSLERGQDAEDSDDAFWWQENEQFKEYWRAAHDERRENLYATTPEWDRLQEDWDRFEATAAGIKPISVYHFQPNNPYFLGESSTRSHAVHTQRLEWNESILEKEAAVQSNPRNAAAWFDLGVKQQENERESKAIQALQRAVELDPSYLAAWLALAISHTNENDRISAREAIESWVQNNERYEGPRLMGQLEKRAGKSPAERHEELIQCLLGLARAVPEGEVDADIQTALGVLLNTSEEYDKAHDCFRTALAVRPNDWLLYNRVGATLANSGRASDALWYYYRALELNPSYIRARFNLGISCINMKNYSEAAEHILDALSLQENDAFESTDKRGITSSALWDCLRTTCLQLQRPDLTTFCDVHDLDGFRKHFWT